MKKDLNNRNPFKEFTTEEVKGWAKENFGQWLKNIQIT
jgi:hypothetical protein